MNLPGGIGTDFLVNACGEKAKDGTKYLMNKVLGKDEQESGGGGDGGFSLPGIGNVGGNSGGDGGFSLPGLDKAGGDSGGDGGLNLGDLAKKGASLGDFF